MLRISYYKKEFWINKGLTEEEAINKISEIKENQRKNRKPITTCLQKEFWIKKGYSEEVAKEKISEIQRKNSSKLTKENRFLPWSRDSWKKRGLDDNDIQEILNSYSNFSLAYWLKKGYSEEAAKEKISEVQSQNSKNRKEYKKEDCNTNIEYYIKRGDINAAQSLYERQNTRSLEKYVQKYGEREGLEKYNQTIEKFKISSWYGKTKEEQIELTIKRTKKTNFYSKSSIVFLEELIKGINLSYKIYWKANEYFIRHSDGILLNH